MINAGELRHYCTLERKPVNSTGQRGQPVGDWTVVSDNVPTRIEALDGRQLEISRQLVAEATHTITIRYRAGVQPGMRLTGEAGQFAGRRFHIGFVGDGDGLNDELILTCTEQRTGAVP